MRLLTASALGRARACGYWLRPEFQAIEAESSADSSDDSSPRARGVRTHSAIDARDRSNPDAAAALDWIDERFEGFAVEHEVPFALDMKTGVGHKLELEGHRRYDGLAESEIPGTADLVAFKDSRLEIVDWKTGSWTGTQRARENDQLHLLAFAAMSAYGATECTIHLVFLANGEVTRVDSHTVLAWEFEGWRDSLMGAIQTEKPVPGPQCKYCQAKTACPGIGRAIAELDKLTAPIRDHDHAVEIYRRIQAVRSVLNDAHSGLASWIATHGSLSLPDGGIYGYRETTREEIVLNQQAIDLIRRELGDSALECYTSKAALGRASKELDGPSAPRVRRVLESLRALGCVTKKTTKELR